MSAVPRKQRPFKRKIITYIFLLALFFLFFLAYSFFSSRNPLFISPLGKSNSDRAKVEKILRDKNISFSQAVVLSDSSYMIDVPDNGQVRLSSQKNIDSQISSLQRILRELTIEGKPFKNIDFRFEEPIISF